MEKKSFVVNLIYFLLIPFIVCLTLSVSYVVLDPFKVVKTYPYFYEKRFNGGVALHKDYVSTMTYLHNKKEHKYDSFIFGNSRSMFFHIDDWKDYIVKDTHCYHFDASGENLVGVLKKLEFVVSHGDSIKNILLPIDYFTIVPENRDNRLLSVLSPVLIDNANWWSFHRIFIGAFVSPDFLRTYIDFRLSHKIKPYMQKKYIDKYPFNYDHISNEMRYDDFEKEIKQNTFYTNERMKVFYKRPDTVVTSPVCIFDNEKEILSKINSIVKSNHTNIKILINPLYDQKKINPVDLAWLKNEFGECNVYDFSGVNALTEDYRNYYENSHFRPFVASNMMRIVYESNGQNCK